MQLNRRDLVLALSVLPLSDVAAAATEGAANSDLLKCEIFCEDTVSLDGQFSFVAALEALKMCRVYVPLAFGYRGFRLYVDDGKERQAPPFYPPTEPPYFGMFKNPNNYLLMYPGQVIGLRKTVAAKEIFPATGKFGLLLQYVPEPVQEFTDVPEVVVNDNGDVVMPPKMITVV